MAAVEEEMDIILDRPPHCRWAKRSWEAGTCICLLWSLKIKHAYYLVQLQKEQLLHFSAAVLAISGAVAWVTLGVLSQGTVAVASEPQECIEPYLASSKYMKLVLRYFTHCHIRSVFLIYMVPHSVPSLNADKPHAVLVHVRHTQQGSTDITPCRHGCKRIN